DLDLDVRGDLRVQADRDGVPAQALDRVADLDATAVELGAARGLHRLDDVLGRHRAEQAAALTRPHRQLDLQPAELLGDLLGGAEVADRPRLAGLADRGDLGLRAAGPADRVPARQQVVAAVAVLDLNHVAGRAEAGDLVGENELHIPETSCQRAVLVYGSRAISRAFLIAVATSRWCWVQLPVTRRARILPRSEMNFRSSVVSLQST